MTHILLIEDDSRIREIVERGLGARGLVVSSAPDGGAGIDLASKLDVDLVLLDLVLPGRHGLEVLEELRNLKPRLPVIALTAVDDTGSKIGGLEAGVDDYITKPFSVEELVARIRARLRWQDGEDGTLKSGPLTVDLAAPPAFLAGREVPLSAREISPMAAFLVHPGRLGRGGPVKAALGAFAAAALFLAGVVVGLGSDGGGQAGAPEAIALVDTADSGGGQAEQEDRKGSRS